MPPPPLPNKDAEHVRTLAICHYVCAGLAIAGIGFLVLHYSIMKMFFANPKIWENAKEQPPFDPVEFFALFQWLYLIMGVLMVVGGVLTLVSGRFIHRRVHRTFSLVIAALNCLHFPFGTALGVFTLVILSRDSVRRLYENANVGEPLSTPPDV